MVKYTQTNRRQFADDLFDVFDRFMNLAVKALNTISIQFILIKKY